MMKMMKVFKQKLLLASLLSIGAWVSNDVQAACSFSPAGTSEQKTSFSFGSITVQRDTPAGTILAEKKVAKGPAANQVVCTAGTWTYTYGELKFSTLSAYGNKVYDTNIDGVGIRIYNGSYDDTVNVGFPFSGTFTNPPSTSIWPQGSKTVQLVKTKSNSVGSGAISTGVIARAYMSSSPRLYYNTVTLTSATIIAAACTVTNTSILVPLGQKMTTDFTGVGSTTKNEAFTIPLNCNANTRVKVTLDATADPSGIKGVIALSPSGTEKVATGVGVQVLYNNNPVTFGSLITVGTAGSGAYTIPLVGRYYQTASKVTSGRANATATFTMTYN